MADQTYQHRSVQTNQETVSQRQTGGKVLQDNRQSSNLKQLMSNEPTANNTGLPDNLKSGIENLSGMSMDNVRVHYNSAKPAQLNALAYAQGTDIHVASGQEKHLPHEAWHVVQQAQGRVKPTMQIKGGVAVNDDKGLEREADVIGTQIFRHNAVQRDNGDIRISDMSSLPMQVHTHSHVSQLSQSKKDADDDMNKALKESDVLEEEEKVAENYYYLNGDPESFYIEEDDMTEMITALENYMSIDLYGVEPTPTQMQTLSDGWIQFKNKFTGIINKPPFYGNGVKHLLTKIMRTKKKQPEMSAGKTIPEIIQFLATKEGQVCNQSIGGGILEILEQFKQI